MSNTIHQESQRCVNCAQPVSTPFCPNCGQQHPPKKLRFYSLLSDFQARIYGFDNMFLRTVKDLTKKPGKVAKDFINGNRVKYFGPVGYFFFLLSVYLLMASLLSVDLFEFTEASSAFRDPNVRADHFQHDMVVWMNDNMRLLSLVVLLSMVFFTWIFFRRSGYNFVETTVLIFFVQGHVIWLSIFSLIIYKFFGYALDAFFILFIGAIYILFGFIDLYSYLPRAKVAFKGFLVLFCSYAVFFVLLVAGIVLYIWTHPEVVRK